MITVLECQSHWVCHQILADKDKCRVFVLAQGSGSWSPWNSSCLWTFTRLSASCPAAHPGSRSLRNTDNSITFKITGKIKLVNKSKFIYGYFCIIITRLTVNVVIIRQFTRIERREQSNVTQVVMLNLPFLYIAPALVTCKYPFLHWIYLVSK